LFLLYKANFKAKPLTAFHYRAKNRSL